MSEAPLDSTAYQRERERERDAAPPIVYRGFVIDPPVVPPTIPLARIQRAARIAVEKYYRDHPPSQ